MKSTCLTLVSQSLCCNTREEPLIDHVHHYCLGPLYLNIFKFMFMTQIRPPTVVPVCILTLLLEERCNCKIQALVKWHCNSFLYAIHNIECARLLRDRSFTNSSILTTKDANCWHQPPRVKEWCSSFLAYAIRRPNRCGQLRDRLTSFPLLAAGRLQLGYSRTS